MNAQATLAGNDGATELFSCASKRGVHRMDGPVSEAEVRGIITKWGELHDRQVGLSAFLPPDDYDPHLDPTHRRRR